MHLHRQTGKGKAAWHQTAEGRSISRENADSSKEHAGGQWHRAYASEYNRLAVLTDGKVPLLEYVMESGSSTFENEKAVEEKLIKPLIRRLGYSEEDYVQQLHIEIGNHNHALIPDFVLHPLSAQGHYSAYSVIEAKRSISNTKQLEATKTQVRSYAKLLGARYAVIASKEKVWVMSAKDDYSDAVFEAAWDELANADIFYSLNRLIGGNKR